NLLLIVMAGQPGEAPIVRDGLAAQDMTDPLPQALILTAIVITFGVSAFLLALIFRSWRLANRDQLEDDADDVAMRSGSGGVRAEQLVSDDTDSEFDPAQRSSDGAQR
ncbi:MAG: NADH-quinone oxidoreductase subunit K, partial [Salinibacterium sp.]|nr:NADH-quinone oxidoreductase subunit K [Salinibacterium sp.]